VRTCVIFNPAAKGEKAQRFRKFLGTIEKECTLIQTTGIGAARTLAAQAVRDGFERIVAAGGDGTLNEVVNGIGDADAFDSTALGLLPLGTVNVFARELMISRDMESAWKIIRAGHTTRIDLGLVSFSAKSGLQQRYFAQLAGAGLDARAVELVHWPLKKRIGPLAYIVAGLSALRERAPEIAIETNGFSTTGKFVLVGNGRLYGGQFKIFPAADLRDGVLDLCVFPNASWFTLAKCAPQLLLRGTLPASASECLRAEKFTLTSRENVPVELDGELVGHLPATFSVQREKLRVLAPA
jgi:diacylglycerol kinase (ATP)